MDPKLHIVHHLYGEDADPGALRRLLEDDALREEYEALREIKFHLDHRKRTRPDPQVIDRIVAAAAVPQRGAASPKRRDRAARPGLAIRRFRLVGAVSAVLAVVLVVGIGLDQFQVFTPDARQADAVMEAPAAAMDAPAAANEEAATEGFDAREAPAVGSAGALRLDEARSVQPLTASPAPPEREAVLLDDDVAEEALPSWDEADELLRVHRRIEMIRARSLDLAWDESAVMSLDSLPTQPNAADGLEAVSTRRSGDNQ